MAFYSSEFKKAISNLSNTEKDKLILRLLKKDLALLDRLYFELVDTKTIENYREELEEKLKIKSIQISTRFYKIGYLNKEVRYLSGEINKHVYRTKDKYGEVSLNLLLLIETLRLNNSKIITSNNYKQQYKFAVAIIARVFKILLLIHKMDEDLLLDFKYDLITLGELIGSNPVLMNRAIKNGLDVNWLLQAEIPKDIVSIYKELRKNGFLR